MGGEEAVISDVRGKAVTTPPTAAESKQPETEQESPPGAASAQDEIRRRLLGQLEQWVDRTLAAQPPPAGLPEDLLAELQPHPGSAGDCDLFTLFSGLTALTGEVRLQGRAFKQLSDTLGPVASLPNRLNALEDAQCRAADQFGAFSEQLKADQDRRAGRALPPSRDVLAVLFDLYERLDRGLKALDTAACLPSDRGPNWLGKLFGVKTPPPAATDAMREGYRLTLTRLEAALHQWEIRRVGAAGEMFDPQRMAVFEVLPSKDVDDGTVLEAYRSGYVHRDQVLAIAQVKVAKRQNSTHDASAGR